MDIIKWRESYATGVQSMDEQHKELIHLVNRLYRIMREQENADGLDEILQQMSDYAGEHLRAEEQLLEQHDYPELEQQQKSHAEYFSTMEKLIADMETDKMGAAREIYAFLRRWWIEHIITEDMKYGEFLSSKGVH